MPNEDPIALYIVIRESLNMPLGKVCAQVGHAVQYVVDAFYTMIAYYHDLDKEECKMRDVYMEWRNNGVRKITLVANEEEWNALKLQYGNNAYIVVDNGLTVLEPGTETVLALWPQHKSTRTKLLKRLRPCA